MSQDANAKKGGWFKAAVTSVVGLFSGAAIMYVSPLVNTVIKPAKPLANFSHQVQGLTVTFQNRSGGGDGWWDFGDGSALEPFSANQASIEHTYPRAGTFTAKLTLRNFLGEENERAVSVNVDGNGAAPPQIEAFQIVPLKPDNNAPATFRVVSKIKNVDLCIWSLGDDRPIDISNDTTPNQDRLVTLREPGYYTLRLVAVGGKQTAEKSETIFVGMGDSTLPTATLQVSYDAVQIRREMLSWNVQVAFPPTHKENVYPFRVERPADGDYHIVDAKFAKPPKDTQVKNVKLEVTPDRRAVRITGDLVRPSGVFKNGAPPTWVPVILATVERRSSPVTKMSEPVVASLNVPGSTQLLLPKLSAGWEVTGRKINLELREGPTVLYRGSQLPAGSVLQVKNRTCRVTATEVADYLQLQLVETKKPLGPLGN